MLFQAKKKTTKGGLGPASTPIRRRRDPGSLLRTASPSPVESVSFCDPRCEPGPSAERMRGAGEGSPRPRNHRFRALQKGVAASSFNGGVRSARAFRSLLRSVKAYNGRIHLNMRKGRGVVRRETRRKRSWLDRHPRGGKRKGVRLAAMLQPTDAEEARPSRTALAGKDLR